MNMKAGVLTASDKGSRGEREDESGKLLQKLLKEMGFDIAAYRITADDAGQISSALREMSDEYRCDLIMTTGGTGFSPRDVTPEATLSVVDRLVPGIPEAIRLKSLEITPKAMLSRAVAGIRNRTLIINLPGSPKAVGEAMEVIRPVLPHALSVLEGSAGDCART